MVLNSEWAGMGLSELLCVLEPVRHSPSPDAMSVPPRNTTKVHLPPLGIPKELWRLVDLLYRKGMREPDLFVAEGDPQEVRLD